MPLPAALLAKLSKRGILTENTPSEKETPSDFKGSVTCPNKTNPHHECTSWCQTRWKGCLVPDATYARRARRLLEKYPLPSNWMDVFDKGVGRYYYWNMETDAVCWLPPKHPKAVPSECAARLRSRLLRRRAADDDPAEDAEPERGRDRADRPGHDRRDRPWRKRAGGGDDLDPMDPAAYSDVPRGGWSDGLEQNKSKADSTASGALYQQRPYPSPGEVLSGNKLKKGRRDS